MATRKFCDICDGSIDATAQTFSIMLGRSSEINYYHDNDKIMLNGNVHVPIVFNSSDICKACFKSVRQHIEDITTGMVS